MLSLRLHDYDYNPHANQSVNASDHDHENDHENVHNDLPLMSEEFS